MWLAAITAACPAVAGALLSRRQLGSGHLAGALLPRSHQPAVFGLFSVMARVDYACIRSINFRVLLAVVDAAHTDSTTYRLPTAAVNCCSAAHTDCTAKLNIEPRATGARTCAVQLRSFFFLDYEYSYSRTYEYSYYRVISVS